jgi:hypothetical protein
MTTNPKPNHKLDHKSGQGLPRDLALAAPSSEQFVGVMREICAEPSSAEDRPLARLVCYGGYFGQKSTEYIWLW